MRSEARALQASSVHLDRHARTQRDQGAMNPLPRAAD
jgi:hypothetical protein